MLIVKQNQKSLPQNPIKYILIVYILKIFVGGLSWDTTQKRLEEYFSSFGKVVEALIMTDRETNKPRGFGFITFESEESIKISHKTDL